MVPPQMDQLSSGGDIIWKGTGPGKMMAFPRGEGMVFLSPDEESEERQLGEASRRILDHLERHGASFLSDIRDGTRLSLQALNRGLSELFWAGKITNDLSRPDGTMSKRTNTYLLDKTGWHARVGLRDGISATYRSFLDALAEGTLRDQ